MALIAEPTLYEPIFNETTEKYNDWPAPGPYKLRMPRIIQYKCFCNGYLFTSNQQWRIHIKGKRHCEALNSFGKEEKKRSEQEKELRIEIEKLRRQLEIKNKELINKEKELLAKDKEIVALREKNIQEEEEEFYDIE